MTGLHDHSYQADTWSYSIAHHANSRGALIFFPCYSFAHLLTTNINHEQRKALCECYTVLLHYNQIEFKMSNINMTSLLIGVCVG